MMQFPHCDQRVLHAPGRCEFCDLHKEWQDLRVAWGINFTGDTDPAKAPCPATAARPLETIEKWGGNRPSQKDVLEDTPVVKVERTTARTTNSGRPPENPDDSPVPSSAKLPDGQHVDHWVMSDADRAKGFVRPVRLSYVHLKCGGKTSMPQKIAETYAAYPGYYGSTFCCSCGGYYPVGPTGEFVWDGTSEKVGS